MKRNESGMTLVELMVVLLIVAVLASIALPSYRQYVLRSHRVEAKTALLNLAAAQEKYYLTNNTYADDIDLLGLSGVTENGWYDIEITDGDTVGFSATATATAKDQQDTDTRCASFTIDSTGLKTATSTDCWQ